MELPSWAFWLVVAVGVLLRILRYADNRSLWLDEAFLALNVREKSLGDLLGPLDFLQSAPAGFLVLEKAIVTILGDDGYGLRALPLAASIAALVLFRGVAVRLLPPFAALLAVTLFAFNDALLYQAAEAKHYSLDVAVSVGLVYVYLVVAPSDEPIDRRRLFWLTVAGALALWLSFPAVLVVGAIFATLIARVVTSTRAQASIGAILVAGTALLVMFAGVYALSRGNVERLSDRIFVENGDDRTVDPLVADVHEVWSMFVEPGGFLNGTHGLAALLALVGTVGLVLRRDVTRLALLPLPIALAFAAALVDRYPLGSRYSFFLVPFVILLVAQGALELVSSSRRAVLIGSALALFLAGPPVVVGVTNVFDPPERQAIKPLLAHMAANWRKGDTMFVYRNAQYALRYYTECDDCEPSGFPWPARIAPPSPGHEQFAPALESIPPVILVGSQNGRDPVDEVKRLPARGRVWLLFSHVGSHSSLDERELMLRELARRGRLVEERKTTGAWLDLYDLRS